MARAGAGPLFDLVFQLEEQVRSTVERATCPAVHLDSWIKKVCEQPLSGSLSPPPPHGGVELPEKEWREALRAPLDQLARLRESQLQPPARREAGTEPDQDGSSVEPDVHQASRVVEQPPGGAILAPAAAAPSSKDNGENALPVAKIVVDEPIVPSALHAAGAAAPAAFAQPSDSRLAEELAGSPAASPVMPGSGDASAGWRSSVLFAPPAAPNSPANSWAAARPSGDSGTAAAPAPSVCHSAASSSKPPTPTSRAGGSAMDKGEQRCRSNGSGGAAAEAAPPPAAVMVALKPVPQQPQMQSHSGSQSAREVFSRPPYGAQAAGPRPSPSPPPTPRSRPANIATDSAARSNSAAADSSARCNSVAALVKRYERPESPQPAAVSVKDRIFMFEKFEGVRSTPNLRMPERSPSAGSCSSAAGAGDGQLAPGAPGGSGAVNGSALFTPLGAPRPKLHKSQSNDAVNLPKSAPAVPSAQAHRAGDRAPSPRVATAAVEPRSAGSQCRQLSRQAEADKATAPASEGQRQAQSPRQQSRQPPAQQAQQQTKQQPPPQPKEQGAKPRPKGKRFSIEPMPPQEEATKDAQQQQQQQPRVPKPQPQASANGRPAEPGTSNAVAPNRSHAQVQAVSPPQPAPAQPVQNATAYSYQPQPQAQPVVLQQEQRPHHQVQPPQQKQPLPTQQQQQRALSPKQRQQLADEERFGDYVLPETTVLQRMPVSDPRPEDNYELSEHGGDSDAEEKRDRTHKKVPKWCDQYLTELDKQADIDPDTIFGPRVPRCNLEEIFTDAHYKQAGKTRPNRKRGSSADWMKDGLAPRDIRIYKQKMGQERPGKLLMSPPRIH